MSLPWKHVWRQKVLASEGVMKHCSQEAGFDCSIVSHAFYLELIVGVKPLFKQEPHNIRLANIPLSCDGFNPGDHVFRKVV